MGQCLEKSSTEFEHSPRELMSQNNSSLSTKHVKKKAKQDLTDQQSNSSRHSFRTIHSPTALEPRRDLPLHKIPELLAKITGTFSSSLSSSETKTNCSTSSTFSPVDNRLKFFEVYADGEIISLDGLLRFCTDLSLEPDCYEVLLFCFLCRAKQMYSLSKNEFLLGLKTLGNHFESLNDIRRSLLNYDVSAEENEFYLWTFHYGLIDGQRCLTTMNAISLWRLFYSKRVEKPAILDRWLNYLEDETINLIPKTITCDTWTIFPQFAKFIQTNGYELYDDSEAWPCLFDDFVEYQLEHQHKSRSS